MTRRLFASSAASQPTSPRRNPTEDVRSRSILAARAAAAKSGDDTLVLDVINDGVRGKARQHGMGLKLAALEALQFGGIVEFGERETGTWRVRLAVPLDRT